MHQDQYNSATGLDVNRLVTTTHTESNMAAYLTTNEALSLIPPEIFAEKRVLTVASSGDQALHAFYCGAGEVVGFDISHIACLISELRVRSVPILEFADFNQFWQSMFARSLDESMFNTIRPYLSEQCQKLIDQYPLSISMLNEIPLWNEVTMPSLISAQNYESLRANPGLMRYRVLPLRIEQMAPTGLSSIDVIMTSNVPEILPEVHEKLKPGTAIIDFSPDYRIPQNVSVLVETGRIECRTYEMPEDPQKCLFNSVRIYTVS